MQENATRAVVGIFDEYGTAERVARELEQAGIPRDSVDVKSNFMTGAAARVSDRGETHEGGISGLFHRLFGGDSESHEGHYSEAVRRGNAVVSVTIPENQVDRVVDIMNSAGAVDIDDHVENYRQAGNYERYDPNAAPYSHDEVVREQDRFREARKNTAIPVVEEELQVGKRAVRRGGVRVYSHVIEQPVEEKVQLREEHVRVERRPADRPVSDDDAGRLRDQSVEVTEMAEEPVIQKRARVREEVVVGKETTERTETIRDKVRRTEVEVERLNAGTEDFRSDFRQDWKDRYASSGATYESYEPAYDYGYRSAGDPRYKDRSWSDVEEDLRTDYMRTNPNSSWDRMKGAVRYGWEKVTGKR
ncbi:MAG: YsnF/AvaK domain-containing protein [Bryobacteraceae bacterium]